MAFYRFKIYLEDDEEIYREIETLSTNTYEELHLAIQSAFQFDNKHAASFFVSDDLWRKYQEITYKKENLELDKEEIKKNMSPKQLMSTTKIAKHIENPRQHFLYVFDLKEKWTFYIELIKIGAEDAKIKYPICTKTIGKSPKQYKPVIKPIVDPLLLDPNQKEEEDIDESEIYKKLNTDEVGIDDSDLKDIQGIEGDIDDEDDFELDEDDELNNENDDENPYTDNEEKEY